MTGRNRILLVDDDEDFVRSLAEQLDLYEDFRTSVSRSGVEALEKVRTERFGLIVLDVSLNDMDGREVCRAIRRGGLKTPVIMLTGAASDADTILGLDAGANDYITKPFQFGVFLARVRAQLRQYEHSEDVTFLIGPYTFRPGAKILEDDERNLKIRLTAKETSILKYLYRAGTKGVSRDALLSEVWGYNSAVTTHTLETHIYRLRQKMERPALPELLVTAPGGYFLAL